MTPLAAEGGQVLWEMAAVRAAAGFLIGAIVGSFLGAALLRWPQGRSVVAGRSRCDGCERTLGATELVPLFSYLLLRGRCRACGAAIDSRQPMMEAAAALIGLVALAALPGMAGPVTALLGWWLLLTGALDADHHWLPDRLTLPLVPAGLLAAWAGIGPPLGERLIGAAAGFVMLAALGLAYRRLRGRVGLGGGDPKLLAGLGAWLGWQQLPLVLLGAGLVGLTSLLLRHAKGEGVSVADRVPLGTLMAVVAWPLWLIAAHVP